LPAAEVRKPARRYWPEKTLASNPARLAYALTMFATDRSVSRVVRNPPIAAALRIG
jgi:hypothetical protein